MRVLIAEDDPVSRRVLQASLKKWGYEVEVACDGQEAWAALQRDDSPRLAVLDWMMPGMDGLQICQKLRRRTSRPYVYTILLTAKSQREDMLAALDAGADDYVVKPFDPHELRLRLNCGRRILDLQAELLEAKEAMRAQAVRDPLTGLPNRLLMADRLSAKLAHAARARKMVAVMFLDLDHFKIINDSLGHNVGDHLLKDVAARLSEQVRDVDTFARMGGDEFTAILGDIDTPEQAAYVARRMLMALSSPFIVDRHKLHVSGSIGISMYPNDGLDAETLVRMADAAMYRAKDQGRNTFQMFTSEMNDALMQRVSTENALRRAVERNQLLLHFQVRVDLTTGLSPGVEALVRWRHPKLGLQYPASFIPLAEDTGLILPVTDWVLHKACSYNKSWQDAGFRRMDVAVNISPRLLHGEDLVGVVERTLSETGLEAQYLNLELTESAVMRNPDHAASVLTSLKQMGVKLSMDDFGTGYSSLGYLKRLPIDALKIDASFVRHITTNRDDSSIAAAIVAMARGMNLKVVAEGVETLDQLNFLRDLGCHEVQGYFISRPVSGEELVHLLGHGRSPFTGWLVFPSEQSKEVA